MFSFLCFFLVVVLVVVHLLLAIVLFLGDGVGAHVLLVACVVCKICRVCCLSRFSFLTAHNSSSIANGSSFIFSGSVMIRGDGACSACCVSTDLPHIFVFKN